MYVPFSVSRVLFVCKCVLMPNQLQLKMNPIMDSARYGAFWLKRSDHTICPQPLHRKRYVSGCPVQGRPLSMGQPGQSEQLAPPPAVHKNLQKKRRGFTILSQQRVY
jgi:hypothetical protein